VSESLNPYIRVANSDAVSDLQDWLASDHVEAWQPKLVKAEQLIALAREVQPPQVLLLHRVGRACCGTVRPLIGSQYIGLPLAETTGPTVDDVVAGLMESLQAVALAEVSGVGSR
jgi:hypothetical protein